MINNDNIHNTIHTSLYNYLERDIKKHFTLPYIFKDFVKTLKT